jgi:hypothetical protein
VRRVERQHLEDDAAERKDVRFGAEKSRGSMLEIGQLIMKCVGKPMGEFLHKIK